MQQQPKKKKKLILWIAYPCIAFTFLCLICAIFAEDKDEAAKTNKVVKNEKTKQTTPVSTKSETMEPKAENKSVPLKVQKLGAGEYVVGNDFPAGRYRATNVGQGSNFIVYGSEGQLKVNTILGNDFGSGDYTFFAEDGDKIQTAGKVKLIPVK